MKRNMIGVVASIILFSACLAPHYDSSLPIRGEYGFHDISRNSATFFYNTDNLDGLSIAISSELLYSENNDFSHAINISAADFVNKEASFIDNGAIIQHWEILGGIEYLIQNTKIGGTGNPLQGDDLRPGDGTYAFKDLIPDTWYHVSTVWFYKNFTQGRDVDMFFKTAP